MEYLAHRNDSGEEQTLKEHLENTAALCAGFAERFGAYDWGYCCGLLHDIGKYSEKFQERIHGSEKPVDHSTAGAKLCWDKKGYYPFISYCIAGHHAGLPDTGGGGDPATDKTLFGRMQKRLEDYRAYEKEIEVPALHKPPFPTVQAENFDFFISFFIRMLYSCLVDADYLDTEAFMNMGQRIRDEGEPIEALYDRLEKHISGWLDNTDLNTINGRRTEILKHCMESAEHDRGLFRLTVPTGGGKTIASLAFALRHAKIHEMDRVIYVIPYTSIIEQNAKVFSDILGAENVLENHCSVQYDSDEELSPMQLAAENWDKPVVVTTNVQFFESLFSNKSSKCRKLHNMANSVIVFDEAQMLPNDYLKPCIAAMEQLLRYYRSSIVLCTATQPALKTIFAGDMASTELCPRMEEQFTFFKRVCIHDLGRIPQEELTEKLKSEHQVLCILNTKKRVQEVYQEIKGEGVFHLSTAMYPVHRNRVLNEIRQRLKQQEKCVVVSTSLVEAGVDLDFQTVYRQLAGVDSIIQAAGRCNREGRRPTEDCFTYVFKLDQNEFVPGQRQQVEVTENLLADGQQLEELDTIELYFKMLYHFRGENLDKKNILDKFKKGNFKFAEVGEMFRIIEDSTKTIFIAKEEEAKKILEELRIKGFTKKLVRKMGKYCVNVYENDFKKMFAAGMLEVISEDMKDDYFVLKDTEKYSEEFGLTLDTEYGQAVIL